MNTNELKSFLDEKYLQYNNFDFVKNDPIQIPKCFSCKEDIEIAAFLTSIIAWGQRKSIIKNAKNLMSLMENSPFNFLMNAKDNDFYRFSDFKHRTFNGIDCIFFIKSLQNIYIYLGGLEKLFCDGIQKHGNMHDAISYVRDIFFSIEHEKRSEKHFANTAKKSAAKRINMFLRWMVRDDKVDFGLWKNISPALLFLPLDVHSANVSRKLGLLKRTTNDWEAVEEVTAKLRTFDDKDPVKYDFALFGSGVSGDF